MKGSTAASEACVLRPAASGLGSSAPQGSVRNVSLRPHSVLTPPPPPPPLSPVNQRRSARHLLLLEHLILGNVSQLCVRCGAANGPVEEEEEEEGGGGGVVKAV